jgi:myo-inositol 2-dehydrogenase/D-chiro-inositol 1-dehydrogenase
VDGQGINRFADNAIVTLRFKGGALATYHCGMHAEYGYDIRTEVHGAKGNIMIGGLNKVDMTVCTLDGGISKPLTFQKDDRMPHFVSRFVDAYRLEMAAFVDCVLDNQEPLVTVDDAIRAFAVAVAAGESAGKHQPVQMADYEAGIA